MLTVVLEILLTALILAALLIVCAVLSSLRPPR